MGKRLFVGSLPFETTETQLQELFTSCGRVESAKVIMDKATGRSKGFGFVEMATEVEAQGAIQKLNGSALGTRSIVVNEARPPVRPQARHGGDRQGPGSPYENQTGGGGFGGNRKEGGFGGRRDDFRTGRRRDSHPGKDRKNSNKGDYGNRW
jgi:RNA recognition motif-containing protein